MCLFTDRKGGGNNSSFCITIYHNVKTMPKKGCAIEKNEIERRD